MRTGTSISGPMTAYVRDSGIVRKCGLDPLSDLIAHVSEMRTV
jgi:hypothetical protein